MAGLCTMSEENPEMVEDMGKVMFGLILLWLAQVNMMTVELASLSKLYAASQLSADGLTEEDSVMLKTIKFDD